MDGTLIDSSALLANTINYVREKIDLPPLPKETIIRAINDTSHNPAKFFYNAEQFEDIHERYFQEYYLQNHHTQTRLYNGIKPLLEKLASNRSLAIATNAYDVSTKPLIEALGIADYFDHVICGDHVPTPKPHPLMIEKIIDAYKAPRKKFVMIGDGERDIMAAKNAGIDALLVEWGFSEHDNALTDVKQLEKILGVS